MILVVLMTLAFLGALFLWGIHVSKPQVLATDMRRADFAETLSSNGDAALCAKRAFEASTWSHS